MKYSLTWNEAYTIDIEADSPEEAEQKWKELDFDEPIYLGMKDLIRIDWPEDGDSRD